MATYWTGSALTADYGNLASLRIQPGYGMLNRALYHAVQAQLEDAGMLAPCVAAEEDCVVHCGFLECHHDMARHEFDCRE